MAGRRWVRWAGRWLGASLLFALAGAACAQGTDSAGRAAGLQLTLTPAHPVLGHPLHLTLRAVGAARPLADVSLAPLRKDFHVQDVATARDRRMRGARPVVVETLSATLYPLRAGTITVPALHLGSRASRPRTIRVSAVAPGGESIRVRSGVKRAKPWVRQETLVYIDVYDDAQGVLAELPAWHPAGAYVRRLAPQTRRVHHNGVDYRVTRLAWAVMALHPGPLQLDFPLLHVRSRARFGKHLLYPVAPVRLQARPLPSYLPEQVPVGRVGARSRGPTGRLWPDRTYTWRVTIEARGLDREGLRRLLAPQLRRAAAGAPGLRLYRPLLERLGAPDGDPLAQRFGVSIPFAAANGGRLRLPDLRVPYVDAASGRLNGAVARGPVLRITSPVWFIGAWVSGLGIGLALALWAGRRLWRHLHRRWRRRRALRAVAAAAGPRAMARALLDSLPPAGRGEAVRTLGQWQTHALRTRAAGGRCRVGPGELRAAVGHLQRACYGPGAPPGPEGLAALREELSGLIAGL